MSIEEVLKELRSLKLDYEDYERFFTVLGNAIEVIERLQAALQEAIEWLDQAPFDYSNGVDAFGVDEGNVRGWKAHQEMVNKFKRLLEIPISDVENYVEDLNSKLPDDDFPF